MKPFVFQHAQAAWPEGESLLHVYITPRDQDRELAALVNRGRAVLRDFPITCVEGDWLHDTLDQVTDLYAAFIPQHERAELDAALMDQLAHIEPFEVLVGPMLSYHSGVIADLHPDEQVARLHEVVRKTIRSVRGDDAVRHRWSSPHLTLAYAHGDAESDQAQRLLRQVRPRHAPLHIDAVHLVDVTANSTAKTISWDHIATIPLGSPS
ncbi:2'-5' RNA ligase family protein [Streptomyces sp. NPDC018045]|uniref:2'-5' RNA ligase family protein n=1 Tax=Streptomyces sp. NPDC018045 TaxID=3365037 RepID=UPI003788A6C7